MDQLCVALVLLALFTLAWAMIFSKAGYPAWRALLMLIPVVNVVWFLKFAFSEWPIEAELARLGGRSPPEEPCHRHTAGGPGSVFIPAQPIPVEETEKQANDPPVEEMFSQAVKLDQRGDWEEAIAVFERIAERLKGQHDGEYARNCAQQIREKMARGT